MLGALKHRTVLISVFLVFFLSLFSGSALAWWNPSWSYRAQVVIDNPSTETLPDYNVLVTLDTATLISNGKMRSDCGDIRFVDSDDAAPLSYWIQGGCGTTKTKVWVRVPNIPASSTKKIYLYYGNPSATSQSSIDIWPQVKVKVSTTLGYLYICGSPASKNTWVNCRIYPGATDDPIILTMGRCGGWYSGTWYSPCDRFQVLRDCKDVSNCYFYTLGKDYGSPTTTIDIDTGSYRSMFELECYTPGKKQCGYVGFSCGWNGNVAHGYRRNRCGCACCDCNTNSIKRLAIHRANPEVTATVKPEESMVKCYTVFYDDFSQKPDTSGKWKVYRRHSDTSNEVSWDSTNKRVYLTRAASSRGGAIFANYDLTSHKWRARFRYLAGGGSGADGFAFHFYADKDSYVPGTGGSLGFDSSSGGYAIEFDNYYNSGCDPSERHIALVPGSNQCNELAYVNTGVTEDNKWHNVLVEYDEGRVTVTVDGTKMLDYTIPNPDYSFTGIGFSASTGGSTNNHVIDDFYLEAPSNACCSNGVLDYGEISVDCGPGCSFYESTETTCNDNKDNDCDGLVDCKDIDCGVDADGDGYYASGKCATQPDCDDTNYFVNPGIEERKETRFVLGGQTFYVPVFVGSQTPQEFYAYAQASTQNPNLYASDTLTIGLYQEASNPDSAYFVFTMDKPNDGSGGKMKITMTPTSASVVVKDDPGDSYNPGAGVYGWGWGSCCTDGMVLGPLSPGTGSKWRVVSSSGISKARVFGMNENGGYYYTPSVSFSLVKGSSGSAWAYRVPVTIDNTGNTNTLTDYQVLVTLDTATLISNGKMRSDCGDLRVRDSDGSTDLPYWIEDGTCNTAKTRIWARVPSIPASSTRTIYLYYGNPSATSQSNGNNVFLFFDDFNDGSIDTAKWAVHRYMNDPAKECVEEGGYLKLVKQSRDRGCNVLAKGVSVKYNDVVAIGYKFRMNYVCAASNDGDGMALVIDGKNTGAYSACLKGFSTTSQGMVVEIFDDAPDGNSANGIGIDSETTHCPREGIVSASVPYKSKDLATGRVSVLLDGAKIKVDYEDLDPTNGIVTKTLSRSVWNPSGSGYLMIGAGAGSSACGSSSSNQPDSGHWIDWFFVRKYTPKEPVASTGSEEFLSTAVNLVGPILACQDGIDNDCDGKIDDKDPGCVDLSRLDDYSCEGSMVLGDLDGDGDIDDDDMMIMNALVAAGVPEGREPCCADLDGDGVVDSTDAFMLQEYLEGKRDCFPGGYSCEISELCSDSKDNDCDSKTDLDDPDCVSPLKGYECNGGCQRRGDTNNDGVVDFDDVRALGRAIVDGTITDQNYCCGDLNRDYKVDKEDIALLEEYDLGERECFPAGYYCSQNEDCSNGLDDDCDGLVDESDTLDCAGACLSSAGCDPAEYCAAPPTCDGTGRCRPDVDVGQECAPSKVLVGNETGSMCTTNLCVMTSPSRGYCKSSCKLLDGTPCYAYSTTTGYTLGVCAYNNQGSASLSSSWSCTPDSVCESTKSPNYRIAIVSDACNPGDACDIDASDQSVDLNWMVSSILDCSYQCEISGVETVADCDNDGTTECNGSVGDKLVFNSAEFSGPSCPDTIYLSVGYKDPTGKCDVVYDTTCTLDPSTGAYSCNSVPITEIPYGCGGKTATVYRAWLYSSSSRTSGSRVSSTTLNLDGEISFDVYGITSSVVCGDGVVGPEEECDPPGPYSSFCYDEGYCDYTQHTYYKANQPRGDCTATCQCYYHGYTRDDTLYCRKCDHCTDGIKNCGEADVDKGGACGQWCDIVVDPDFVRKVLRHYSLFPQSRVLTLRELGLVLEWYTSPGSCDPVLARDIVEKAQKARFFDIL